MSRALLNKVRRMENRLRLRAARAVIELGTKLRDSADLAERVADLEDQMRHSRPLT